MNRTPYHPARCKRAALPALACPQTLQHLRSLRQALYQEVLNKSAVPKKLLNLALAEAEALAWQTAYPHLLFPSLAAEKVDATVRWHARQSSIKAGELALAE